MKKEINTEKNFVFLINIGFSDNYSKGRDSWSGAGIDVAIEAIEHTDYVLFRRLIKEQIIKRIENYKD